MDYKPPSGVRAEAKRALKWIEEGHAGGGFTDVGRKRASDLARGASVSRDTIGRIANYLARHESDKKGKGWNAGDEGYPSAGRVAWAAWGGDPARSWTAGIINSEEKSLAEKEEPCERTATRNGATMTALKNRERILDVREERSGATPLEFREDKASGQVILRGYAATYEPYDCYGGPELGGWVEQLRSNSFEKTLQAQPDVMLLLNHAGAPLARTKSGTMTLTSDRRGLMVEARLDPSDPDVQALLPKMRRGDLDEMSFSFRVKEQEWDTNYTHRTINEVSLQKGDVSVVNYGMNPNTHVVLAEGTVGALAALSKEQLQELRRLDSGLVERAIANLNRVRAESRSCDEKEKDMKDRAAGGNPFADDDDMDDEEAKAKRAGNPFADEDDEEDDEGEKKAKRSGNPFADDEDEDEDEEKSKRSGNPFADDEEEDDDEEAKSKKRSLDLTGAVELDSILGRAFNLAEGNEAVQGVLRQARAQLDKMRGLDDAGQSEIERHLRALRKESGAPDTGSVADGFAYLRSEGNAPMGLGHRAILEDAQRSQESSEERAMAGLDDALAAERALAKLGSKLSASELAALADRV